MAMLPRLRRRPFLKTRSGSPPFRAQTLLDRVPSRYDSFLSGLRGKTLESLGKESAAKPYRDRVEVYALKDGKVMAGLYPDGGVGVYGGGIEPGETPVQAAKREYLEEGGLSLKAVKPLAVAPLIEEWKRTRARTAKEKERSDEYRGSRTHFFVAELGSRRGKATDGSEIMAVRPRRLDSLIERMESKRDEARAKVDKDRTEARLEVLEQIKETEKVALGDAFAAIQIQPVLKHGSGLGPDDEPKALRAIRSVAHALEPLTHHVNDLAVRIPRPKKTKEKEKQAKEFAPGIPARRQIQPIPPVPAQGPNAEWMVSLSKHPAARRGDHFDLRLVDEDGKAHSWALQDLPKPGQSVYAAQQPTHKGSYALRTEPFSIPHGVYGGTRPGTQVEPVYVQPAEVVSATSNRVHFLRHAGSQTEEFVLRHINSTSQGPVWALHNSTKNRATIEGQRLPDAKPAYKEVPFKDVDVTRPNQVMTAKIDGAHTIVDMPKEDRVMRVYSYRPSTRDTGLIEHTFKFPQFQERIVPPALKGTMIRAETWASKDGKAIPASELGGLLNSSVPKSRKDQADRGVQMRLTGIDVVKYQGKDYSSKPYEAKLEALRQISKAMNGAIELPPMATTPEEKTELLHRIRTKTLPETSEGVVIHRLDKAGPFIKAKVRPDFDVYVRDIFKKPRTEAKGQAGGFSYSLEPGGPVVGRVGSGLTAAMRKEMFQDPDRFRGRVAKVEAASQHQRRGSEEKGALIGSPAFKAWHLDKTDPDLLKTGSEPESWDVPQALMDKVPELIEQSRYGKSIATTERLVEQSPELHKRMDQILGRMRSFSKKNPGPLPYFGGWYEDGYYE